MMVAAIAAAGGCWRSAAGGAAGGSSMATSATACRCGRTIRSFSSDVFTFVRVVYNAGGGGYDEASATAVGGRRGYGGGGGGWATDYPDSDLNFSFRLQQLTSLKVNPQPVHMPLTDPELFDYPFIYMIEPGDLEFTEDEVAALRQYLLNGGFLMVDDFWGDDEWENFYQQIKRVFPDREPQELPLDHEIFHCVYRLKEKPQMPSINAAHRGPSRGHHLGTSTAATAARCTTRAIFDDKGRMMAIICHNTDLGDGWEREGEDAWYFQRVLGEEGVPDGDQHRRVRDDALSESSSDE